jgi:hypothetical protein
MPVKSRLISYVVGGLLIASGLVHFAILLGSGGSWSGPLSLRKPMAFGLSFGITLITITWVTSFLSLRGRGRTVFVWVFAAASVLETGLVTMQAWRGVPSHFNVATPFDALVTRGLAGGGVVLVLEIAALTVVAFRPHAAVPASLRLAVQVGFVLLSAAMVVGGVMIGIGMRQMFAGNATQAYATGGALKPTHAIAMHGILVLPVVGRLLAFTDWGEERQLTVMRRVATAYVLLAVGVAALNLTVLSG